MTGMQTVNGILCDVVLVTRDTSIAHIVDVDDEQTACGRLSIDADRIQRHAESDYSIRTRRRAVGPGSWHSSTICQDCDERVPDDLQAEAFDEQHAVSGLTVEA